MRTRGAATPIARFLQRAVAAFLLSVFALTPVAFAQAASVAAITAERAPREERIAQTHGVVQRARAVTAAAPERVAPLGPALLPHADLSVATASFTALVGAQSVTRDFASLDAAPPRARGPPIA